MTQLTRNEVQRWRGEIASGIRGNLDELDRRFLALCDAVLGEGGDTRTPASPVQRRVLTYIRDYSDQHGCAPSYIEIAAASGIKSKSGVHRHVTALIGKGYLTANPGHKRSLRVIEVTA